MSPTHSGARGRFATTQWTMVLSAGRKSHPNADSALGRLCETYWSPVYAFVRRRGHSSDEAADLTQAFFVRVLEKSYLRKADPARGRFRSFLLSCLQHFLSNEYASARTLKRGGRALVARRDTAEGLYRLELRDDLTPDRIFDRRWATTLIGRSLDRLAREHAAKGKRQLYAELKDFMTGDAEVSYAAAAKALGISEGATKVAAHRLRRRFRAILVEEIAATVADPRDIDDEIRYLMQVVSE